MKCPPIGVRSSSITQPTLAQRGRPPGKRGGMSPEAKARIAAAQRARWARQRGEKPTIVASPKRKMGKRTMSPEARERIAAAQRARWAKHRKS